MIDFNIERNIHAIDQKNAITFAHKKNICKENQHKFHLNDHVEIYIYLSGNTHYVIEDQYYVPEKGDILVIPPYSVHAPILKGESVYERFYLLFPLNSLSDYISKPLSHLISIDKTNSLLRLPQKEKQRAMDILYRMSDLAESDVSEITDLLLHALALEFLCIVNINQNKEKIKSENVPSVPSLVRNVLEYISGNCTELNGIAGIAQKFYVSEQHLATVFKKHVGVTVNSYLQAKKISLAKKMLEDGHSVTYTCYECGFNDCSYFIKVFKKIVGVTPQKYVKSSGSLSRV